MKPGTIIMLIVIVGLIILTCLLVKESIKLDAFMKEKDGKEDGTVCTKTDFTNNK